MSDSPRAAGDARDALTVYYDGGCPVCRREIDSLRSRAGFGANTWIDVSVPGADRLPAGITREHALARMHVRDADGELKVGARAFLALWSQAPALRRLRALERIGPLVLLLDSAYEAFLVVRRLWRRDTMAELDRWLARELRSDHAGEFGATWIYRGMRAVSRDAAVRSLAWRHLLAESRHLRSMERRVAPADRSLLLPVWRAAGFATGAVAALAGPRAVFRTLDGVEQFVDRHYGAQIERLAASGAHVPIRLELERCRADELAHRDEARDAVPGAPGWAARLWWKVIAAGSVLAVALARRF